MPPADPDPPPTASAAPDERRLKRIDRLGELLDESIRLPVVDYRIGYDAILGLIPGVGDATGLLLSSYIIYEAARFGVSKGTLLRMVFNTALEALVGTVPVVGDVFDATWKANLRNLDLLHEHLGTRPGRSRSLSNRVFFGLILLVLVLALFGVGALLYALIALII